MASWRSGRPAGPLSPFGLALVATVVVIDQGSKFIAEARLPFAEPIGLLPILTLFRTYNTGIAFSMFAGFGPSVLIWGMLVVSAIVVAFWATSQEGGRIAAAGFALILGGAIGNLVDRIRFGHVVDFLLLHFGGWTLFVFNLADVALTLGPALLLLVYLWPAPSDEAH